MNECGRLPYTRYDGVYHTPLGRCSMHDISTAGAVGIMLVPKRSALKTCCRDFSEDVGIVRYCYLLGFQAIELGKPPQGGVMHTVVPGKHLLTIHFGHSSFVWPMLLFSFSVSQGVKTRFAVGFSCRHGAGQKRGFLLGKSVDILYE